jgi:hypothetical protein
MDSARVLDIDSDLASEAAMDTDDELNSPAHEEVAELAYSYWEARGSQGGSPWEDWFRAERELAERELKEHKRIP